MSRRVGLGDVRRGGWWRGGDVDAGSWIGKGIGAIPVPFIVAY